MGTELQLRMMMVYKTDIAIVLEMYNLSSCLFKTSVVSLFHPVVLCKGGTFRSTAGMPPWEVATGAK